MSESAFTMKPRHAALLLGVHSRSVTRRADRGSIPYERTTAGHHRFRPDDIEYIAEQQEWPPPGTYTDGRQARRP